MFIFKIWNIIFPQASENENTGFNISRGKYAFKALPEPACNVNRQAINGSHRPQSGPALLQSCCWRLLVSQCEETLLSPHLLHVRVPRLKEHLLYSPAPHFPSSAGESWAWLSPAKIKCFSLVASCVAREIFSPMVPFCYYPSADGRGKARMCFVSWQGRGQGKAKPVPTGIFWLGFAACSLALLCSDYGPAQTSFRLEVTNVVFGEISNMWPLYRNGWAPPAVAGRRGWRCWGCLMTAGVRLCSLMPIGRLGCDELAAVPGCHGTDETHLETWQCEMKLTVSAWTAGRLQLENNEIGSALWGRELCTAVTSDTAKL